MATLEKYLFRSLYTKKTDHHSMVFFLSFGQWNCGFESGSLPSGKNWVRISPPEDRQARLSGVELANHGAKRSYPSAHGGLSERERDRVATRSPVPSNSRFAVDFRAEICYNKLERRWEYEQAYPTSFPV